MGQPYSRVFPLSAANHSVKHNHKAGFQSNELSKPRKQFHDPLKNARMKATTVNYNNKKSISVAALVMRRKLVS